MKTKRFLSLLLSAMLLFSCLSLTAHAEEEQRLEIVAVPTYFINAGSLSAINVGFSGEEMDIPYISLSDTCQMLQTVAYALGDYTCVYDMQQSGNCYQISRENGSFFLYDADSGITYLSDIMGLTNRSYASNDGDCVGEKGYTLGSDGLPVTLEDGSIAVHYLSRGDSQYNFVRSAYSLACNLQEQYGIEFIVQDGELYLPVATVNDLLLDKVWLLYNGAALFLTTQTLDDNITNEDGLTLKDLYYAMPARARSQALADFNYNELCLFLDLHYGLAQEHGVTDGFQSYFAATGLKERLCSTDSQEYEAALSDLLFGYMGDRHSGFLTSSSYAGEDYKPYNFDASNYFSMSESFDRFARFEAARNASGISYEDENGSSVIAEAYSEVGDTAFITFDEFLYAAADYYAMSDEELALCYAQDTVGLVIYANAQINRENSPIRKVVIDLSDNGGGAADAAVYITAWLLGETRLNVQNPLTNDAYTTRFTADVNLDGVAGGEGDSLDLDKLDVYCLISGNSFSCGNLLPSLIKQDGRITLIGQTSGGGACVVQFAVTADGSIYRCSGLCKLCVLKNGSYYSIDQGVEPDIPLRKLSSYYDREELVSYLDTIR